MTVGSALCLLLPWATTGAVMPESTYDRVVQDIVDALGALPPTAVVNGVEVPAEHALGLLRKLSGSPMTSAQLATPDKDIGLAQRIGPDECLFGVVVYANSYGADPLVNETFTGAPNPFDLDGSVRCGPSDVPMFPYLKGVVGAAVNASASYWHACLNQGVWLDWPTLCHVTDFRVVTMAGHVGYIEVRFPGDYRVEYLFCGVANHTPDLPGERDLCTVMLEQ